MQKGQSKIWTLVNKPRESGNNFELLSSTVADNRIQNKVLVYYKLQIWSISLILYIVISFANRLFSTVRHPMISWEMSKNNTFILGVTALKIDGIFSSV